jgi:hypothetical protein
MKHFLRKSTLILLLGFLGLSTGTVAFGQCSANNSASFLACIAGPEEQTNCNWPNNTVVTVNMNSSNSLAGKRIRIAGGRTLIINGNPTVDQSTQFIIASANASIIVTNGTNSITFRRAFSSNVTGTSVLLLNLSFLASGDLFEAISNIPNAPNLPITLQSFSAQSDEEGILVSWSVSSELNNDHMVVEKSLDGGNFYEIGRVKGRGTATSPFDYHLVDRDPRPGPNYYRLRQVDTDGKQHLSKVILANKEGYIRLFAYPNPTTDYLQVRATEEVINSGLHLMDMSGRKILLQWTGGNGMYETILPSHTPAGLYILTDAKGENRTKVSVVK